MIENRKAEIVFVHLLPHYNAVVGEKKREKG